MPPSVTAFLQGAFGPRPYSWTSTLKWGEGIGVPPGVYYPAKLNGKQNCSVGHGTLIFSANFSGETGLVSGHVTSIFPLHLAGKLDECTGHVT